MNNPNESLTDNRCISNRIDGDPVWTEMRKRTSHLLPEYFGPYLISDSLEAAIEDNIEP